MGDAMERRGEKEECSFRAKRRPVRGVADGETKKTLQPHNMDDAAAARVTHAMPSLALRQKCCA